VQQNGFLFLVANNLRERQSLNSMKVPQPELPECAGGAALNSRILT
jgi:hypothetical protein